MGGAALTLELLGLSVDCGPWFDAAYHNTFVIQPNAQSVHAVH